MEPAPLVPVQQRLMPTRTTVGEDGLQYERVSETVPTAVQYSESRAYLDSDIVAIALCWDTSVFPTVCGGSGSRLFFACLYQNIQYVFFARPAAA